ncbi:MAG: DinB family protein [Pyrinomonadaceae bacterium]|nr:DinB family protein [Pyrinomonadaceae bacterium]
MIPHELANNLEFLEETPKFIKSLTENLTGEELRLKPSQEEFSLLEHVCHLRDIEQEGYRVRINKLLNEAEPFLPDIDGDKLATERNYNSQSFTEALSGFACARTDNIQTIRNAPLDALKRTGLFGDLGIITLERLVMMMYEHDSDHRQELSDLAVN